MTRQTIAREASRAISEKTILPITMSLLFAGVVGVWALAMQVSKFDRRLEHLENDVSNNWTYAMEREIWHEFRQLNPELRPPDATKIKREAN